MSTARVIATVTGGGLTCSMNKSLVEDGVAAVDPTGTAAVAGTLTTRTNDTDGVVTCVNTDVTAADEAVLTWVDAGGNLKHRYNVTCAVEEVADSSSGDANTTYEVTISGGAGDNLPAEDYVVNISKQVLANITFDFDDVEVFAVYFNVRGVVAFLDGTDTEKRVMDVPAGYTALWTREVGFDEPITGTPVTYVLVGSGTIGSSGAFTPKVIALYDSTDPAGSGQ